MFYALLCLPTFVSLMVQMIPKKDQTQDVMSKVEGKHSKINQSITPFNRNMFMDDIRQQIYKAIEY